MRHHHHSTPSLTTPVSVTSRLDPQVFFALGVRTHDMFSVHRGMLPLVFVNANLILIQASHQHHSIYAPSPQSIGKFTETLASTIVTTPRIIIIITVACVGDYCVGSGSSPPSAMIHMKRFQGTWQFWCPCSK